MIQHILAAHEDRYQRAMRAYFYRSPEYRFDSFRESTASCLAIADLDPNGVGAAWPVIEPD